LIQDLEEVATDINWTAREAGNIKIEKSHSFFPIPHPIDANAWPRDMPRALGVSWSRKEDTWSGFVLNNSQHWRSFFLFFHVLTKSSSLFPPNDFERPLACKV
jgi:hypothetical protein